MSDKVVAAAALKKLKSIGSRKTSKMEKKIAEGKRNEEIRVRENKEKREREDRELANKLVSDCQKILGDCSVKTYKKFVELKEDKEIDARELKIVGTITKIKNNDFLLLLDIPTNDGVVTAEVQLVESLKTHKVGSFITVEGMCDGQSDDIKLTNARIITTK